MSLNAVQHCRVNSSNRCERKRVTLDERQAFIADALCHPDGIARTFCLTLAHTRCRISEALELNERRIDLNAGQLVFRSSNVTAECTIGQYRCRPAIWIGSNWYTEFGKLNAGVARLANGSGRGRATRHSVEHEKLWKWLASKARTRRRKACGTVLGCMR